MRRRVLEQMSTPNVGSPWSLPPLNSDADRVRAASSLAAGLLAGFSVTAIATLITTDRRPWLFEPTLMLFSIAASSALLALNYQSWAQGYWSRPDDFMTWRPRARLDVKELQQARRVQHNDMSVYKSLIGKADLLFKISASAFFMGIFLLLFPNLKAGHISIFRWISLGIVALGLFAFLLTGRLPGWQALGSRLLAPELYGDLPQVSRLTDDDIKSVASDNAAAARMKLQVGQLDQAEEKTIPREAVPFATKMLDRLRQREPAFLEQLVLSLLTSMGYSPARVEEHLGKVEDEGLDGMIRQDHLGLVRIYVQANRYEASTTVHQPEIQKFVEALDRARADGGIFITTSSFTQEAVAYADRVTAQVVLIDGLKLSDLLIRNNIDVHD